MNLQYRSSYLITHRIINLIKDSFIWCSYHCVREWGWQLSNPQGCVVRSCLVYESQVVLWTVLVVRISRALVWDGYVTVINPAREYVSAWMKYYLLMNRNSHESAMQDFSYYQLSDPNKYSIHNLTKGNRAYFPAWKEELLYFMKCVA